MWHLMKAELKFSANLLNDFKLMLASGPHGSAPSRKTFKLLAG